MLARVLLLAVIVCLYVCVSVCHTPVLYRNGCKTELVFLRTGFSRLLLHCFEEVRVSPKVRILSSGPLSKTLDLENLASVSRTSATAI